MPQKTDAGPETLPDLVCACANLRRAARLVTQLYSHEMGPAIDPSQFALLSAFQHKPGIPQTALGRVLGLDKTTLSRNLRLLVRNGWIEPVPAADRRARGFRLTAAGEAVLGETQPGWRRAQLKLQQTLGADDWRTLAELAKRVALSAKSAQQLPEIE